MSNEITKTLNKYQKVELEVFFESLQTDIKDMNNFLKGSGEFVHTNEIERFLGDIKSSLEHIREELKM